MNRNPLSQLASIGEEVLDKASQNPTAARVIQGADAGQRPGRRPRQARARARADGAAPGGARERLAKLEQKPVAAKPKPSAAKKPSGDEPGAAD